MKKLSILALAFVLIASLLTACRDTMEDMTNGDNSSIGDTTAPQATKPTTDATKPSAQTTTPSAEASTPSGGNGGSNNGGQANGNGGTNGGGQANGNGGTNGGGQANGNGGTNGGQSGTGAMNSTTETGRGRPSNR